MNVSHPAPDELLLDYAAGAISPGKALLVATHLAVCPESRTRLELMRRIGGALLDLAAGDAIEMVTAEGVLALAGEDALERETAGQRHRGGTGTAAGPRRPVGSEPLPWPISAYHAVIADRRGWRRLGLGVEAVELPVSMPNAKTQLLRARPGVRIPEHTHIGEEAVLVLKGAFTDDGVRFAAGDVAVSDDQTVHAPVIDDGEICLCLAVTEGPIRFVGRGAWALNLVNRF